MGVLISFSQIILLRSSYHFVLDFHNYLTVSVPRGEPAFPSATGPLGDARPCHARPTAAKGVIGKKKRTPTPNSASGGGRKEPSRGRLARSPGKEWVPGEGGVSNIFGDVSLPCFSCPCLGFPFEFFGDGTLSSPGDFIFVSPREKSVRLTSKYMYSST